MRIQLKVRQSLDLEAIEYGQTVFTYRCYARLRFQQSPGWSEEFRAILDTGAPFSVIPSSIWQSLAFRRLFPSHLRGVIPRATASLPADLAKLACVLTDEQTVSSPIELTALLVDVSDVPLLLGWAGCLDRARLHLDGPRRLAWLEF